MSLEEQIFQKNVPGRWSSFEGENDDHREDTENAAYDEESCTTNTDQEFLDLARKLENENLPEPIRRGIIAEREKKSKTGVKGVIADYKQHCQMEHAMAIQEALLRQKILTRMAEGSKRSDFETEMEDDDDLFVAGQLVDEDDLTFLEDFRRKRIQEMQATAAMPVFGACREVDSTDFSDMVDKEDARVFVVVHLYETSLQSCVRLNVHLEQLAARRPDVKFLRMNASLNQVTIDRIALPILTVYRGGKTVDTFAALDQELGLKFTLDDVEWFLETKVLGSKGSSSEKRGAAAGSVLSGRLGAAVSHLSDDDEDLED